MFRTIKPKYYLAVCLIIVTGIFLLIYNKNISFLEPSEMIFLVGLIALSVSILSLGIADASPRKMKLSLKAWSRHPDIKISGRTRLVVKIFNHTKVSLKDLKVNVRIPSKIYVKMEETDVYLSNSYGESTIFNFDYTYFLGSGNTDNIGTYELTINHSKWNKGNIWFTITSEGFEVSTYSISQDKKESLINSNSKNPITLKFHE